MSGKKIKAGVVGCGVISEIYMSNITNRFKNLEIVATMDLIKERAEQRASQFNIPKVHELEDFYKDPEIELVVNLTTPQSHYDVDMRSLKAGKHVYSEKPFALNKKDGKEIIELAKSKNLLVGCAPETFLGGGLQMCRKLIVDGWIGTPVAATAFMMCHGHESWHPDPGFYYDFGGGPMFDMGPYYLTALVSMLGPVEKVAGTTKISFPTRRATCKEKYGEIIKVNVPTYVAGSLTFKSGAIGTIITTFDVWDSHLPNIEIYGSEGSLRVPDPNTFGGPVLYKKPGMDEWREIPVVFSHQENSRGIGVSDMAQSILNKRTHRAHGDMANHVLDIMCSIHDSSDTDKIITLDTSFELPAPFPQGLPDGVLD
ncbi:MAG: Gfo/Idh/MocA family oxidoreductase [Oscillospiraceae bacterium]|nr:Gfo/Idh/MocA family oxidoreductase [Oscillospiraceae bacterium]